MCVYFRLCFFFLALKVNDAGASSSARLVKQCGRKRCEDCGIARAAGRENTFAATYIFLLLSVAGVI